MEILDTIEYRGHDINIYPDFNPLNPWEDWDGQPPLISYYDGHFTSYGIDTDLPELNHEQIISNKAEICEQLEFKNLLQLSRDYRHDYFTAVEAVNAAIEDCYGNLLDSDKLEFLGMVYNWAGIDNYVTSSHGCSQGDYAELLIVATPEYLKEIGLDEYTEERFKSDAELWGYWAWGEVYGYGIEPTERNKEINCTDSCWGFYGYDHENSNLLEMAKNSIDCEIKRYKEDVIENKKRKIEMRNFMQTAWAY